MGRVNAEALKGAGAKGERVGASGGAVDHALSWPRRRDFGSSRIEKRERERETTRAKKWQRRERGPAAADDADGDDDDGESATEPRAGKIGVRCTLAAILALNRPRRFHPGARLLLLVDRLFAPTNRRSISTDSSFLLRLPFADFHPTLNHRIISKHHR